MELAVKIPVVSLLLIFLASAVNVMATPLDVTKYGAVADEKTDMVEALKKAWTEACASTTPSTIVIPPGTYMLGKIELTGPCKAPIELQVQGTVKAPTDPSLLGEGWVNIRYLDQFTMSGNGVFDGQGPVAWQQNNCHENPNCKFLTINLSFSFVNNSLITGVTTLNSKNFHVNVLGCSNFTFNKFNVSAPAESPNTDGIHIGRSDGVQIIDTTIGTGDDCISLGDGCKNINVTGVTCGPGHGISIGSLGKYPDEAPVTGVWVKNCTLANTDNGVRIKSWPALHEGAVSDIHFEDIIVNNVSNPVLIDQVYCPWNQCNDKLAVKIPVVSLLLIFLASAVNVMATPLDVTKYGAVADEKTDMVEVKFCFKKAWTEACASTTPSTIVIPPGTYMLGKIELTGPCKAPIELQVQGTVKAPTDPSLLGEGWVNIRYLDQFTMSGNGVFDGQGPVAWQQNNCHENPNCKFLTINLSFSFVNNSLITGVTTLNSKNFHVNVLGCSNFTFNKFNVSAPAESPNTDGIHIGRSDGVQIIDTTIGTGDDCISLGDGCKNINVTGVTCGPGHGISIGSLGKYPDEAPVTGVWVKNCTLANTDNGVRIKSWPALHEGAVSDIHFEDIIVNNVSNPVLIDQVYCPWNQCNDKAPSKVKISGVEFKNIKGTSNTPLVVKLLCSSGIPCEGVSMADIDISYTGTLGPAKSECTNVKPTITGALNPAGC
ncbi:hypothetical protein K2173_001668 [Erythroxylum novogranatense]|uniref:Polygalacturonase n=1 Tax=Erythroxylum novogranatense TaxID=1862640 RepID=A0AAV8T4R6_9ROSI|nr:hypothetical protein K2173_001668 [Erythroxylum novogranatense]